jgi:hypothetical protein
VTQIDYYTERVKRMVGKVLTGNGITRYNQGAYGLVGGEELSDAEREELLQLCRQRLDAFRMQRGEEVFAHRSRHRTPISGSIKCRVLTRAKGRCECCGAHEDQRALEVAHIVPRNQGGSDDLSNLQALCFRCNAGKRDTDSTDFRGQQASYASREEWNAVVELLKTRREQLSAQDASISGWNVGLNSGEAAGQTVFHAHWHLIPRREGDCEEPRGGVRGVIGGRQGY